jgi:hypothetical protein
VDECYAAIERLHGASLDGMRVAIAPLVGRAAATAGPP